MEPQFSTSDLEKMRTILAQHDSAAARENNNFDLNNPPRKNYTHRDFPRLVYNHDTRKYKTVQDSEEFEEALQDGFQVEPFSAEHQAPVLNTQDVAEVEKLDEQISEARRRRKAV